MVLQISGIELGLRIVVADETGVTYLDAYDHVMLSISNPRNEGAMMNFFPSGFDHVMG
ncbi:hypothetical protein A2U01_0045931, partial [Trifolium medium]|nr:hypothetical protein [Trifolium medium]